MSTEAYHEGPGERLRRVGHEAAERLRRARRRGPPSTPQPEAQAEAQARPLRRHKALYWTGGVLATLVAAIVVFLLLFDWNWLRGPLARYASARMHREVTIAGDLRVHLWSWQPSATVDGVRIANPSWAGSKRMADIGRIAVQIRLLPLFRGHVDLRLLEFDKPQVNLVRDAQGRANWDFSDGKKKGAPLKLPPIRRFIIDDGHLTFADAKRHLNFSGTINAAERLGVRNHGFEMAGQGTLNQAPFRLQVTGGPLLNIERTKPYPFDADISAGATRVTARGAVPRPFDLGQLYMDTTAQGPDLADLYDLTGVALPNTPPYKLQARFVRDEHLYKLQRLSGRVGDSDLAGFISVDSGRDRPLLKAELRTRSLDFDDLGAIFGGAPKTGAGETASAGQKVVATKLASQQRFLPDSTLKVDRIRAIDAEVDYRAASIRDAPVPLRSGSVKVDLKRGLLKANPLTFDLPQGRIAGQVTLNARQATPVTDMDLKLSNARVEQLLPIKGGGHPIEGALMARAKLTGAGASVHRAAANADGEVVVVIPGGQIRQAFAELMGINVTKGLGLLLSKDQQQTPIRCAVAHFQANNGVLTANQIVFDTGPVLGTGSGSVNLDSETMSFRLEGHPKEFRLVRLMAPITVNGPIRSPKLGIEPGKAIAQGGFAAVLASVVSPIAAILPFVDPGLAKDAACGPLVAGAAKSGAPVKAATVAKR